MKRTVALLHRAPARPARCGLVSALLGGFLALGLVGGPGRGVAEAGPLNPSRVAGDARWVAHLDVERLLTTQVGGHVGKTLVDRKLAEPLAKIKQDLDLELDWRQVRSITAYGWEFKRGEPPPGVLLVESGLDLPGALEVVIDRFAAQVQAGDVPIQKSEYAGSTVYSVKNEWHAAGQTGGLFLLARSRPDLERALQVVTSRAPSLARTDAMRFGPRTATTFFEAGLAEGVLAGVVDAKAARVLGHVAGGWILAGEADGRVQVRVGLQGRDVETAGRVQHVVQGLAAVGVLVGSEQPDLLELARSAEVSVGGREVQLGVSLPAEKVLAHLPTGDGDRPGRRPGGSRGKGKAKGKAAATGQAAVEPAPGQAQQR